MIELISLHIPKTAGRSFFSVLKSVYGEMVDIPRNRGEWFPNRENPQGFSLLKVIPKDKTVLHGHLEYRHVVGMNDADVQLYNQAMNFKKKIFHTIGLFETDHN